MIRSLVHMFFISACLVLTASGQEIPLPGGLQEGHPRLLTTDQEKGRLRQLMKDQKWAGEVLKGIKNRIDPYLDSVKAQPDWLYSRLMMYWKSKATQVYINGGVYAKADGEAPVPTVRFGSSRGIGSPFNRPALADIIPYMDDTKGVYFRNSSKPGAPLEWVEQSQASGGSIESINEEIMKLAKDAAFLYWLTDDQRYARLAFGVIDTYLTGMYYRTEPIDLNHGHAQTLVGMTTFEVIQERILNELAYTYDFLYNYIDNVHAEKKLIFETALKKCIDLSIKNGVPHNNWNLHKSKFILKVAMVLGSDKDYADRKGWEYYVNTILNKSSARHWSLPQFMAYGYDKETGIWNESPGYAQSVGHELTQFIRDYDNTLNQNLLPYIPVMYKAVTALPQYQFPNGLTTAFGDSYYGRMNLAPLADMIRLTQKYKEREQEVQYTKMYKLFQTDVDKMPQSTHLPTQITSFFTDKPLVLDRKVPKGELRDYVTPTFYSPNVSWFVQRNKYHSKDNGMMISQYASLGNHMHANGLAMELYGRGYVLGAESGIGSTYFEKPYLEYYSQFPAHNTVMVDGISKYPEMLSTHGFHLLGCYPKPGQKDGYYEGITYSDMYFLEPESQSDQNRMMSIVNTGPTTGYYVDIFRSKKQLGGEKYHDYFYHNLGQELKISEVDGQPLNMKPSDEMGFAGGHLFALDYMWDKLSARTDKDYEATWKMSFPDNNHVYMNLWMKGYKGREIFSIKAPALKSYRKEYNLPYDFYHEPYLTIAARQHGEAWKHPFVAIYEPTVEKEGKSIISIKSFAVEHVSPDFVGLHVESKGGRHDYIFSSIASDEVTYLDKTVKGTYGLVSEQGDDFTLFLGNGHKIAAKDFSIDSAEKNNVVLERKNGRYFYSSDQPVRLTYRNRTIHLKASDYKQIML
ncbi:hypothetical protein [Sphingobacterium thalpophilum]|uniref:hypothetical protein n=1 Tax=Sphingobacterium thalpophilum TaxID=259 RepID=UPI003C7557CF